MLSVAFMPNSPSSLTGSSAQYECLSKNTLSFASPSFACGREASCCDTSSASHNPLLSKYKSIFYKKY